MLKRPPLLSPHHRSIHEHNRLNQYGFEAWHALLANETDATLTITYRGLGVTVVYSGFAVPEQHDPLKFGVLNFVPVDETKNSTLPDCPPAAIELRLDETGAMAVAQGATSMTLRWGNEAFGMELAVNCDAP